MSKRENEKDLFIRTLNWICDKLESANIPYMITGGAALGFWGHVRTTMDVDIIIKLPHERVQLFLKSVKELAYVDQDEVQNAVRNKRMFNIIYNETCFKVDLICLDEADVYEKEKFEHRKRMKLRDREIYVISAEDLILSKLLWNRLAGGSERQFRDCESILKLNKDELNLDYVNKWSHILGLDEYLQKIK